MRKRLVEFLIPGIILAIFAGLNFVAFFQTAEKRVYDLFLRLRPAIEQRDDILFMDVDDTAIANVGLWPWSGDYMGRGPKDIHAHLLGDLLVVRLQGALTAAQQHLVKSLPAEKGRDLLKQVRIHLVETARPVLEAMVQEITGIKVLSLHHDISTITGEEVILFTLVESPDFRVAKKK